MDNGSLIKDKFTGVLADGSEYMKLLNENECILIKDSKTYKTFQNSIANQIVKYENGGKAKPKGNFVENTDPIKTKEIDFKQQYVIVALGKDIETLHIKDQKFIVDFDTEAYMSDMNYSLVIVDPLADKVEVGIKPNRNFFCEQRIINQNFQCPQ